jgi:hypothetical protein
MGEGESKVIKFFIVRNMHDATTFFLGHTTY